MKKKYLFVALLLPLIFSGCDGNFGVKHFDNTFLVINVPKQSEIELFCQSEKFEIQNLEHCEEITEEGWLAWTIRKNLPEDDENFKLFEIKAYPQIRDRYNINIYFEAKMEDEVYSAELYISCLQEDSVILFTEPVLFTAKSGNTLSAVFTYSFMRSI